MKIFLKNIAVFLTLGCVVIIPLFYWAYSLIVTPKADHALYIWGDSQMCQGLDMEYINAKSKYHVFSAAQHGAGVYDFLVFAQLIPKNSTVIISNSKPVIIRSKNRDKNISMINLPSIYKLIENNYSFKEVGDIILKNLRLRQLFFESYALFENKDSVDNSRLSFLKKSYSAKPYYFNDKANLYKAGLQILKNKNCKIIALDFPFYPIVNKIEDQSPYKADLQKHDDSILEFFEKEKTLFINNNKNVFEDYTHLNQRGAIQVSEKLLPMLDSEDSSVLIKIVPIQK